MSHSNFNEQVTEPIFPVEFYKNSVFFPTHLAMKYGKSFLRILMWYYGNEQLEHRDFQKLEKEGLVEQYFWTDEEILKVLKSKTPQHIEGAEKKCEWCNCSTFLLNQHHYPIKKLQGGKDVVNICSNCHYEYHHLLDTKKYRLTKEIEQALKESENHKQNVISSCEKAV